MHGKERALNERESSQEAFLQEDQEEPEMEERDEKDKVQEEDLMPYHLQEQ